MGLISALIRLTLGSAAPAAICAMLNLIFSQVSLRLLGSYQVLNPLYQVYQGTDNIVSTAFNMALPKLYVRSPSIIATTLNLTY